MKFRVRYQSSSIQYDREGKQMPERDVNGDPVKAFETKEEAIAFASARMNSGACRQIITMDVAEITIPVEVKDIP